MQLPNRHTDIALLLRKIHSGDEQAFRELFYCYKAKLFSFLLDLTRSRAQAEDMLQEIFLKIWKHRSELLKVDNFDAYIFTVGRNLVVDSIRRIGRESKFFLEPPGENISSYPADREFAAKEIYELYRKALDRLPPQQLKIYLLHSEKGLRQQEIANQLNLSLSTVQNHMFRAVQNIRNLFSGTYAPLIFYLVLTY